MASLIKSRKRVIDHGEVFTPPEIVEAMLDLVKSETERIDSRFLEPACGSGNFLVAVLRRKLTAVEARYGQNDFERKHYALLAMMSLYGIELLEDNVTECRDNLLGVFTQFVAEDDGWRRAGRAVLEANIIWADALTMRTCPDPGAPIVVAEWSYVGKGTYWRRDFRYDALAQMSSAGEDTLFSGVDRAAIFEPNREYPPMTYLEVADG
ncbi:MAG: N-6 DNA methylase [Bifidobacteriaceae bacterium]|nr:N-6 DNA methylase [Bifidobacteriaceae bacterium]